jgi:NUDIX domain
LERFHQLEAIATEIISRHSDHSRVHLGKIFSAEQGYSTPKIDVRGAVFKGDRILMVKERAGGWTLPGGYVDVNESLSQAIEREVADEHVPAFIRVFTHHESNGDFLFKSIIP